MIKISPLQYIALGSYIESARTVYYMADKAATDPSMEGLREDEIDSIRQNLIKIWDICEELKLPVSHDLISSAVSPEDGSENFPKTGREYNLLIKTVRHELRNKLFLFVEPHRAEFYESDKLVSEKVQKAFPKSTDEIRMAGNTYAASLDTAVVFHCMRAVEIGLRTLAQDLNITFSNPVELMQWQDVANAVSSAIKKIANTPKTQKRDDDLRFYSQAASQFQYFKDGWRIHVAHARETYTEPQAKDVIEHVCAFFETLSDQLEE